VIVEGVIPDTQVLGTHSMEEWVEDKSNKAFLHFLPKFCHPIFDDFSKQNFEKSSKMAKNLAINEENPCLTCLHPIFRLIPGIRKMDFR